jgi:thiosulfate reductase cytochrome b subunit
VASSDIYPFWLRVWHGLHALLFCVLVFSGLRVHYSDTSFGGLSFGGAIRVHNLAGAALAALYVFFVVKNATSRNMRHYSLPRPATRAIARQLRWYFVGMFRGDARPFERSPTQKLNPAQSASYLLVMYALTPASVLSGVALWFPQLAPAQVAGTAGVWPMALLHLATGWGLSIFLLLHLYMVTTGDTLGAYLREITRGELAGDLARGTPDARSADPQQTGDSDEHARR